jgi:RHS repeat-associated protein
VATSGLATGNTFGFTGRENDGTGLNYHRARYYSSTTQRFTNSDPIGLRGGDVNLFAYGSNDPVSRVDPLGQTWTTNWRFFGDWFWGRGPKTRTYGQTDQETVEWQTRRVSLHSKNCMPKVPRVPCVVYGA